MDLSSIIATVLLLLFFALFNLIGFPYAWHLFPQWKDKGFPFAKLIPLLMISYVVWLLVSLKLVVFSSLSVIIIFFLVGLGAFFLYLKNQKEIDSYFKKNRKLLLYEEGIFLIFFFIFVGIRWLNPDLWHPVMGGEKPMDFAFLNAILKSSTFPPYDPWYAGETINYYYFGQYIIAVFIKLTSIPPAIFYNLALAFLFGQSAVTLFSIVFQATASKKLSLLGSIFGIAIGNLAQVPVILKSFAVTPYINAWYWTATRVMPNSEINEFPFFTFLYADLHAHLIALPLAIFVIALVVSLFTMHKVTKSYLIIFMITTSLLLGMLRAGNIWDYPTYLMVVIIGLFFSVGFIRTLITGGAILLLSNLVVLPFILNYKTAPIVVKPYLETPTRLEDYFIIHGFFLFILISFLLFSRFHTSFKKRLGVIIILLLAIISIFIPYYSFMTFVSLFIILHLYLLFSIWKDKEKKPYVIVLLFSGIAFFLTLIPDVINLPIGLGRMNTVFKFYYQAWIFFALASAMSLPLLWKTLHKQNIFLKTSWIMIFVLLFIAAFSYVPTATSAKTRDRMSLTTPYTLDGMEYMKSSVYFDKDRQLTLLWDYLALHWMNENIHTSGVVLEANAPIYRWGSRVSVYTGLPTIIGWDWHEQAHRSYLDRTTIDKRISDVTLAYETTSFDTLSQILQRYNVRYIYLGQLEKAYYNNAGFTKFNERNLFDVIYENKEVTIYKVK